MKKTSIKIYRQLNRCVCVYLIFLLAFGHLFIFSSEKQADAVTTEITSSTSEFATSKPFQRKTWHDGVRYWSAVYSGTDIDFYYSSDGSSWTQNSSASIDADISDFSIEANSSNAYIAYSKTGGAFGNTHIYVRKASSYPSTSFTWSSETLVLEAEENYYFHNPTITKDTNGKVWISGGKTDYSYEDSIWAIQSTNSDDITAWQASNVLDPDSYLNFEMPTETNYSILLPLPAGGVYAIWRDAGNGNIKGKKYTSGVGWDASPTDVVTFEYPMYFSAVAETSGDVHLIFSGLIATNLYYKKYSGTWEESNLYLGNYFTFGPKDLSLSLSGSDLFAFYRNSNNIYYKKAIAPFAESDWGSSINIYGSATNTAMTSSYNGLIGDTKAYAIWTNGSGPYSIKFDKIASSSAPTISTPSAQSTSSIRWNFTDNASDETGFKIHDSGHSIVASSATANLTYLDEVSLSANTQYTRHAHSYNDVGDSSASSNASAYTKIETPSGISFDTVGSTSLAVSATGTLSNLTSGSSGVLLTNTTEATNSGWIQANSWNSSSLAPNTQYTFKAQARNGDSTTTSETATSSKYTLANTPGAPALSNATSSSLKVVINENSNPSNTTYAIYNNTTSSYVQADGTLGASPVYQTYANWGGASGVTNTGLSSSISYTYKVKARNGDDADTTFGSNSSVTNTIASVPISASASAASTTQININWSSGGNQDHYHVKSSLDDYASDIYNSTGTSTSQSSLIVNSQYSYRIYGVNADDVESATYASVSKYTLSDPPTLPVATDGTYTTKINVSWTASLTANHYHVYKDGVSGVGTLVYDSTGTSFDDTTTGNHDYYIYAANGDNINSASYISDSGSTMTSPTAPTIGTSLALSTTSIRWNFTDNASNEAGFKIHDTLHDIVASSATANLTYLDEASLSANTQYTRHAHAYNDAADSSASSNASAYTAIQTPTGISFDTVNANSLVVSAAGTLSNLNSGSSGILLTNITESTNSGWTQLNTWSSSSLTPNTQYTFKAQARNGDASTTAETSTTSKYTLANAPAAPTTQAVSTSLINVIINTNSNPASTNFAIQESTSGDYVNKTTGALQESEDWGTYAEFGSASGIDVTALSADTQYSFKVKAKNAEDTQTALSSASSNYTLANTPGAPTLSNATATSLDVLINTNSNPAITTYAIYNNITSTYVQADGTLGAGAVYQTYANWGGANGVTNTGLSANTSYTYKVKSRNGDDVDSAFGSNSSALYTLANTPASPTASAASTSQININWSSGGTQNHYHVKSSSDSHASNIYNSTSTSTSQSSLTANTQYTYRIFGVNADDAESATYASVSKYTLSDPPTLPVATDGTYATKINVGWTASLTANHYHVYKDGIAGVGTLVYDSTGTSFDDTTTGSHTYYIYSVNSEDDENSSYITDSGSAVEVISAPSNNNLSQIKPAENSVVSTGGYTNETSIRIRDSQMSGIGSSTSLAPQVEIKEVGTAFDGTNIYTGSAVAYSGSAVDGYVEVTGLEAKSYYYRARTRDNNNVVSAWTNFNSGNPAFTIDTSAPSLSFSSPTENSYVNGVTTLTSSATDNVGIASVSYYDNSLSALINTATSGYLSTWNTIGKDGAHIIYAVAKDVAGSKTTVSRVINVDNFKPKTAAPKKTVVKKGRVAKLFYMVTDPYTGGTADIIIKIMRGKKVVKTLKFGDVAINKLAFKKFKTIAKGKYKFKIYATDNAGNTQANIASNNLIVM